MAAEEVRLRPGRKVVARVGVCAAVVDRPRVLLLKLRLDILKVVRCRTPTVVAEPRRRIIEVTSVDEADAETHQITTGECGRSKGGALSPKLESDN